MVYRYIQFLPIKSLQQSCDDLNFPSTFFKTGLHPGEVGLKTLPRCRFDCPTIFFVHSFMALCLSRRDAQHVTFQLEIGRNAKMSDVLHPVSDC